MELHFQACFHVHFRNASEICTSVTYCFACFLKTLIPNTRFIPGPWQPCSRTCGAGTQRRTVKCQVLLSFSQTVADLPDDECDGVKPEESQPCYRTPCSGVVEQEKEEGEKEEEENTETPQREELHDWEYEGFTECSESCGRGMYNSFRITFGSPLWYEREESTTR